MKQRKTAQPKMKFLKPDTAADLFMSGAVDSAFMTRFVEYWNDKNDKQYTWNGKQLRPAVVNQESQV